MIINPSSYSFTPPANMVPVTGFVMRIRREVDDSLVSEYSLPTTATGGSLASIRPSLLAGGFAGMELNLTVHSTGYNAESPSTEGAPTFTFQPAPDPPSGVIVNP